jgi:hypothetical protein
VVDVADPSLIRSLPTEIRQFIARFVARQRLVLLMRAIVLTGCFILGWSFLVALIDRLAPLPGRLRLVLGCAEIAAAIMILWRPAAGMIWRDIVWTTAAAAVEQRDPRLDQRLQTITSQLAAPTALQGSPQLLYGLMEQVAEHLRGRDGATLVSADSLRKPLTALIGLGLLIVLCSQPRWLNLPTLLLRQLKPLASIAPVTSTHLTVEPGNASVIEGEPLRIAARVEGSSDHKVTMRIFSSGNASSDQPMALLGENRYTFTLSSISRDCLYAIIAGDAQSPVYSIRLLHRPVVLRYHILIPHAPEKVTTDGRIVAPVGTSVTLRLEASEPLRDASLLVQGQRIPSSPTSEKNTREVRFTPRESGTYSIHLLSQRGVYGSSEDLQIRALSDGETSQPFNASEYQDALRAYFQLLRSKQK